MSLHLPICTNDEGKSNHLRWLLATATFSALVHASKGSEVKEQRSDSQIHQLKDGSKILRWEAAGSVCFLISRRSTLGSSILKL